MTTRCVLKVGITNDDETNELSTNNSSKIRSSIENPSFKPSKSSNNAPINSGKGKNKHTKIINNDGNNLNKTKKNRNEINVKIAFMNAMTDAIIRFLDKNPDINKGNAEKSVFIALGYDISIENDEDEMYKKSFLNEIKHYRCHHIMRDRDAIRTFRIKQLHNMIKKQHPSYGDEQVLKYLTEKLNELYLPSPSPPPPPPKQNIAKGNRNKKNKVYNVKNEELSNKSDIEKVHENKSDDSSQNMLNMKPSNIVKTKNCKKISQKDNETKNINCTITINESQHNNVNKNVSIINNDSNKKNKFKKIAIKSTINNNNKREHKRDLSPSQIYITVNETFSNKLLSESSLKKYKNEMLSTKPMITQQSIGFKQQTVSNNFIHSTSKTTKKNNNNQMLLSSLGFQPNKLSSNKTTKYNYFNNEEEEIVQKMKLHKKCRKRKFVQSYQANEFEMNNFDKSQIVQPPKKRSRYEKKMRRRTNGIHNKSRGGGGGGGKGGSNKYKSFDNNHSTDCFDDEEDDGSDIDLNANNNNLRHPQSQHL